MSVRGRPTIEAWEQARVAASEAVVVTTICAWCPENDRWTRTGPVGENGQLLLKHRQDAHPEVQPRPRRTRRPHRQFSSHRNLDDNIANAREQGAATWAGPV